VLILHVSAAEAIPERAASNTASPIFLCTESSSETMAHANRRGSTQPCADRQFESAICAAARTNIESSLAC
jgi:hypothetical protein